MMPRRLIVLSILMISLGIVQPLNAQNRPTDRIDFSKSRLDSTTIELCHKYIPKPLYMTIASSQLDPRIVPAFVTVVDYPSKTYPPQYKLIYASDGTLFGALVTIRRTESGEWEYVDRNQEVPPGNNVKLRLKDLTGDGKEEVIATARGGQPRQQAWTALEFDESGRLNRIVNRPKSQYDHTGTIGVAVAAIDSLGQNGRPAIEVWQDDSTHFAARYVRIRHQYDEATGRFRAATVDTLPELPSWCAGRRRGYEPQE